MILVFRMLLFIGTERIFNRNTLFILYQNNEKAKLFLYLCLNR